ncbi:Cysteine-rich protein [Phytophthora cinnamomi]|uniref:Cysteine-rich protein n=1 Tax=Phytophthora cinnamomi TaxID=4785 RepID=UPI003559C60B|nr:Cysteine-rich protein [Phytophthora cinnamomi]
MLKSAVFALAFVAVAHAACPDGQEEISVQGIDNYFCVDGEGCSGSNALGLCPDAQDGLEFGSYCDLLETDVYGCKPYSNWDSPSSAEYDAPLNCTGNIAGDFPVSVEDGNGTFCSTSPVCSGTIAGNCPGVQDGLPSGSECVIIQTGVYGVQGHLFNARQPPFR